MKIPALLFILIVSAMTPAAAEKFNYLIVLGDDISSDSFGCFGSPNPNTSPHIDQLASEGIQFTNMFVAQATCAPTRAELYTGLLPYSSGVFTNHKATKKRTLSIVQRLSALGYRVGLTGKAHIKPSSVYPFEKLKGFEKNCNHIGPIKDNWEHAEAFMTRDSQTPFCLVVASTHAHAPWDAGDSSHWDVDTLVLPDNLADTPETRRYYREYLGEVREFDRQVGDARALLAKHQLDNNTVLIVIDENGTGMPGGKWTTYDWGVRSACIMKWPTPYDRPFKTDAIAQYCDILPTLIAAAGGDVPTELDGKSLLPIIKGQTQTHRNYGYFVHNSLPSIANFSSRAITNGRFKLIWTLTPDEPFRVRVINGYKSGYVDKMADRHVRKLYQSWDRDAATNETVAARIDRFDRRPEFQLYDLNQDPYELDNLVESTEHVEILGTLQAELKDLMAEQQDPGLPNQKGW